MVAPLVPMKNTVLNHGVLFIFQLKSVHKRPVNLGRTVPIQHQPHCTFLQHTDNQILILDSITLLI